MAITQCVQNIQALHANLLPAEVTRLNTAHRLPNPTSAIPSPTDYFHGVSHDNGLEKKLVVGYIDFIIAAINDYITSAAPHSNEMHRRAEQVTTQLGR